MQKSIEGLIIQWRNQGRTFGAVGFLQNFRRKFFYYCVQSIYRDKVVADKCKRCKVYNKSCPSKPLANDEQEKVVKFFWSGAFCPFQNFYLVAPLNHPSPPEIPGTAPDNTYNKM